MWNFLGPARTLAQSNPWLKWAVVVLVGLFALEFIAQRGVSLYVQLETAPATVAKANGEAEQAKSQGDAMRSTGLGGAGMTPTATATANVETDARIAEAKRQTIEKARAEAARRKALGLPQAAAGLN